MKWPPFRDCVNQHQHCGTSGPPDQPDTVFANGFGGPAAGPITAAVVKDSFTIRVNNTPGFNNILTLADQGPIMEDLDWLQKHMRDHLSKSARNERGDRVLRFPGAPPSAAARDGRTALSLVYQAAEVVRSIEDRANEVESRARSLAEEAIEQLRLAEQRIEELETKQRAAETCIDEANVRLQEADEALKIERSRVKAAEDQLPRLEMRARAAEARAIECENALSRIEDAIRTQLLRQGRPAANRPAAAA